MSVYFKIYRQGKRYTPKQLLMDEDKDAGSRGSQTDDQKKENVTGVYIYSVLLLLFFFV